jgi:hypothetical protein
MQAQLNISWTPTTSRGIKTQRVEVWNSMGQLLASQALGPTDSAFSCMVPDTNTYLYIYVYSLNSMGQGGNVTTSVSLDTSTQPEGIPDAPTGLNVSYSWIDGT